ncbi:hypothetical protein [Clostridium tetanomorphum]|uniref:hypothetical protein n=1 Tax=Clostridium tetanomorphum TaxID=1553 RepID=UPI000D93D438|nr:hypothetical protein [Clostridium tetanomorphum]SQC00250.1 membrane-associated ATP-binding domain-containing protein [Clostridium tetanomorphum]
MITFNVIEKILFFVSNMLGFLILYITLKGFLGFKTKLQYMFVVMLITANIPSLIVKKFNIESIYQWIPTAIYVFIICLIFCKGTCFKKIIVAIIYICFNELLQYITVPFIYMPNYIDILNLTYHTEQISSIVSQLFFIITQLIYILIFNFVLKNYCINNNFKDVKYMMFFVIPNVFIVALLCEYFKLYYKNNNVVDISLFNNLKMMGFAFMALICAVLMVIILDRLMKENTLRQKEALLAHQFNIQARHYKDLQIQFKNTRVFKHDINNHLICIKNLIANDDIKSTEQYIKKVTETLESLNLKVNTGNVFADAVISEKYNISIDKNIDFKCNIKYLME